MKKFTRSIAIFLLPILFLAVFCEVLIRRIPNDYEYKKSYLDHHAKEVSILFLGSSHVYYGIDPKYIKSSFNASYISQSFDYDLEILKKYSQQWDHLKYIVIPVDYFSFYGRLQNSPEAWRAKNYRIYYDINTDHKIFNSTEILSNKLDINLSRLLNHYVRGENDISCSSLGWGSSYKAIHHKDLIKSGVTAAARHTAKDNLQYSTNLHLLDEIIAFAEHKHIKVVLFTSPAYKSYVSHLSKNQLKTTLSTIKKLNTFHTTVRYFNLLQDSSFHAQDFYDGDHLNEIGAKKLSLKMNALLAKI
ncbi:hypothetical protein CA265_23715 [Sphingobacteriaceae bacterium GW460-11-11-14-LB5]|nr:hypothetical protein CA265_23715 [Sphingobacteriaceae bacterium GW460-11-11-14-LB5]